MTFPAPSTSQNSSLPASQNLPAVDWTVSHAQYSYAEALTPNMTIFQDGAERVNS